MGENLPQAHSALRSQARIIDGKAASAAVLDEVRGDTRSLLAAHGVVPGLAVVIVGANPASQIYVRSKERIARECGFHSVLRELPEATGQAELLAEIARLNGDAAIHGILVQLPLPAHLDSEEVIRAIDPSKDVDGLHLVNAGKLASGDLKSGLIPCTPAGVAELVRAVHGPDLSGLRAVVIGRSNLFGKPMAQLLLNANATVTMAHSRTADMPSLCRMADILVAAVGRAGLVRADWIKPGATVIDVGINQVAAPERGPGRSRVVGDVDFEVAQEVAGAITPVPGGVGPMTLAMLMVNTLRAARRAAPAKAESCATPKETSVNREDMRK